MSSTNAGPASSHAVSVTPSNKLRPHQKENVIKLIQAMTRYGAALDASDTGTGKTFVAIGLCEALNASPAIVCPLPCKAGWQEACDILGVKPLFIESYEKLRRGDGSYCVRTPHPKKKNMYDFSFQNMPPRTIIIFDEVQRCRGPKSLHSKMLLAAARTTKTLMLSATPFTTPLEARSIGFVLKLFTDNGFFRWARKHGVRLHRLGHMHFAGTHKDMLNIHHEIFGGGRGVRTKREDIPGFPNTVVRTLSVEPNPQHERLQLYLKKVDEAEREDMERATAGVAEDLHEFITPLAITKNVRARQRAELTKVPVMAEIAKDALLKGYSVPIFLNFDLSIDFMMYLMRTRCCLRGYRPGGEDNLKRGNTVRSFQANTEPVIIVNAQAGGAGVNLHDHKTKKPRHAIISPPWSAVVLKQVLGRSHRSGGGYSLQDIVFSKGTVEDRVMKRVRDRLHNIDTLTDGDLDAGTLDNGSSS